ncbi:hypothetical protein WT29_23315 [Burkholderia stagnalis]|uniref:Uncharacterized protein n=1 Tax=Burkholderia stagnalis TaxID=1503054 RepID=A0A6L3MWP2_9BURK|nr:hypothetical protein [Burkholderia stagnalis]KAB0637259.1 hypothetical protein F7R25_15965 [Burkholderia stagnalis]KVW61781.1 hypothetical protein WT28_15755 [Burkholderia stagnalis]KVW75021.1 hypothetical protein WT29_23315 [Burkholderia stagnalis]KVX78577.1 hypothetical protein WT34_10545 [Burkholderia stagnalis]KWN53943.1 hypothetical protein WT89_23610 [Burkholderia stagnalis]
MLAGVLALVGAGVYLDRKFVNAGGASGVASNIAGVIWDNAAGVAANAGTSIVTDMAAFADDRLRQQQAQAPLAAQGVNMPFPTSAWDVVPAGL